MDLRNNIIRMCPNIRAMLIDRGYAPDSIPNTDFTNILDYKIKEFIDDDEDTTRILDFFVTNGETKDYVFFYKGSEKGFKINKIFFENKVQKYFREIESVKGLNINFDNFTFVLVKRKITRVERELVDNFESSNPHIRICDCEKFLFNITAHKLVSKHSLYKKSYRTLLKKLMLDSPDKLPYILHADPISKHFNFRDGEIIEIERDTMGKKITMYRVCKNFNYSHLSYKSGLPKSDPPPPLEDVEELEDTVTVEEDVEELEEVVTVKEDVEETGESHLVEDNDEAGEEEGDMIEEDVENEGEEDDLSEEVKETDEDKGHGVNLKKIIKLKKKF